MLCRLPFVFQKLFICLQLRASFDSVLNLQLRSIEEPLGSFLTEYEDSITWISDNEVLLKPVMTSDHMEKHKDLIEVTVFQSSY